VGLLIAQVNVSPAVIFCTPLNGCPEESITTVGVNV
jgi:hypothetical protein